MDMIDVAMKFYGTVFLVCFLINLSFVVLWLANRFLLNDAQAASLMRKARSFDAVWSPPGVPVMTLFLRTFVFRNVSDVRYAHHQCIVEETRAVNAEREDVQLEVGHDGVLKLSVSQAAEKKVRFEGEEGNPPPPGEGRAEEPREGEAGPEEQPQQPAIKWRRVERARRFESRAVQLPPDADAAAVSAALADGVLRLSVPKKAEPASRRIEVH